MSNQSQTVSEPITYIVEQWGSHPDKENDDCWDSEEFKTLDEAQQAYDKLCLNPKVRCVALGSQQGNVVDHLQVMDREGDGKAADEAFSALWRKELRMEAGMLHGIDA